MYSTALQDSMSPGSRSQRSQRSVADADAFFSAGAGTEDFSHSGYELLVEHRSLQQELKYEHDARSDAETEKLRVLQRLKLEQLARQDLEAVQETLRRERNALERRTHDLEVINSGLLSELELAKDTITQLHVRERLIMVLGEGRNM